jgi:O-antigen ligase
MKKYAPHLYYAGFFFILFFNHKHIDFVRFPFFLFILWKIFKKELSPRFLIDPVSLGIFSFAVTALISNWLNGIPQNEIVQVLNWLFPYYLGKYTLMPDKGIEPDYILFNLLGWAALFSCIGIAGHFLHLKTLLGVELFDPGQRYAFTISGTNRAGTYIGVTLILVFYFFIKNDFKFTHQLIFPAICFPMLVSSLFLIKERKGILTILCLYAAFLLIYKKYKLLLVAASILVLLWLAVPLSPRYQLKEMPQTKTILVSLNAWESAIDLFKQKPIFGHGYPSFKIAHRANYLANKNKFIFKDFAPVGIAHNLIFNALAETGLLGCIALNAIFFSAWRFFRYRNSDQLLFTLGVTMLFIYVTMQFSNFEHSAARTDMTFLILGLYQAREAALRAGSQAGATAARKGQGIGKTQ